MIIEKIRLPKEQNKYFNLFFTTHDSYDVFVCPLCNNYVFLFFAPYVSVTLYGEHANTDCGLYDFFIKTDNKWKIDTLDNYIIRVNEFVNSEEYNIELKKAIIKEL